MVIPQFVYSFTCWRTSWLLSALGIINKAAINTYKFCVGFNIFFKLNLLGWNCLIRLYWFQSRFLWHMICILITLCAHQPKSSPLPSLYIWPTFPFTLTPLPSGNHHTVVCVYEFRFYILHMKEIICFLAFSDWLTVLSILFSRSTHVVTNGSISSFLKAR